MQIAFSTDFVGAFSPLNDMHNSFSQLNNVQCMQINHNSFSVNSPIFFILLILFFFSLSVSAWTNIVKHLISLRSSGCLRAEHRWAGSRFQVSPERQEWYFYPIVFQYGETQQS